MNNNRLFLSLGVTLLVLGVIVGATVISFRQASTPTAPEPDGSISPFELYEVQGSSSYHSDNGRIKLLAFILTNCPDGACPMTMDDFALLQDDLQERGVFGEDVELLAITFDPDRDTPDVLRDYAGFFGADPEGWKFLRDDEQLIRAIADELGYLYRIDPDRGTAVHAITMYLIDDAHRIRARHNMTTVDGPMDRTAILRDIDAIVAERSAEN